VVGDEIEVGQRLAGVIDGSALEDAADLSLGQQGGDGRLGADLVFSQYFDLVDGSTRGDACIEAEPRPVAVYRRVLGGGGGGV
jgi:hypothetical protein